MSVGEIRRSCFQHTHFKTEENHELGSQCSDSAGIQNGDADTVLLLLAFCVPFSLFIISFTLLSTAFL
jgi:hypothetical protein